VRILDTDVCVKILRGNSGVISRRRETLDTVVTSWITVSELFYGAAKSVAPGDNQSLVEQLLETIDVVGLDPEAARRFGALKATLEADGQRLADADLLIASIALANDATLVTGNHRHYQRVPALAIEDWIRSG